MIFAGFFYSGCNKSSQEQPRKPDKEISDLSQNKSGNNVNKDVGQLSEATGKKSNNNSVVNSGMSYSDNLSAEKTKYDKNKETKIISIPGNPIKPDKLKNFLPDKIPGTTRTIPSTGIIMNDNNQTVSNVSATYSYKKGGILISIHDYGKYENIPDYDKKYYINPPEEPGFENEVIQNENGKGFLSWDPKDNSGKLHYLLANRIVIQMDGYLLPKVSGGLMNYLEMINIKTLIDELSKNK